MDIAPEPSLQRYMSLGQVSKEVGRVSLLAGDYSSGSARDPPATGATT